MKADPTNNEPKPEPKPDDKKKEKDKGKDIDKGKNKETNENNTSNTDNNTGQNSNKKGLVLVGSENNNALEKEKGLEGQPDKTNKPSLSPTQSVPAKNEEEAYQRTQRDNATIEDCINYIKVYGKKGEHGENVLNKFQQLYRNKLKSCTSEDQINSFIKKHPQYMEDARIVNSKFDSYIRDEAKKKLEQIQGHPKTETLKAPKLNTSFNKGDSKKK